MPDRFDLVTCEHAGNEVPAEHAALFQGASDVLHSHRGWDPGALGVAQRLATRLHAPMLATRVTRLLVEANRPTSSHDLFSGYTRHLPEPQRHRIINEHHEPHWSGVRRLIALALAGGHRVLHIGVHSFVDELDGQPRALDLGLLFDPQRPAEAGLCNAWAARASALRPDLRVRSNEPYHGTDEGLTTSLRAEFPADAYLGIEIELRQGLLGTHADQQAMGDWLADSLPPEEAGGE